MIKISNTSFGLFLIFISSLIFSCASSPRRDTQEISETSLDQMKGKTVSIIILNEEGKTVPATPEVIGTYALLEYFFISPSSDLKEALAKHKFSMFVKNIYVPLLKDVAKKFEFQVAPSLVSVNQQKIAKNNRASDYEFDLNLNGRFPASKADLILAIRPHRFGAVRKFFSFVPLSGYEGVVNFSTTLIDAETNKVLAHHSAEFQLPANGHWDQPPTYGGLVSSMKEAFKKSSQSTLDVMFPYE